MSWDKRVNYYQKWKYFFKALPIMMSAMIVWDIIFTHNGIWGFNEKYILGWHLAGLPIEEWMFFIVVPFSCTFIYEVVVYYDSNNKFEKYGKIINVLVLILVIILLFLGFHQMYTKVAMGLLIVLLLLHQFVFKAKYLGRFYVAFMFILIPFFIMNGILTGSFIQDEVVWYKGTEIFGIRLFTIPLEDVFYSMLMMLLFLTLYEKFKVLSRDYKKIGN